VAQNPDLRYKTVTQDTSMTATDFTPIFLIILGLLQLVIAVLVIVRRGFRDRTTWALVAYSLVAGVWEVALGRGGGGWVPGLTVDLLTWVSAYAMIVLALLFMVLNRSSWRTEGLGWQWWLVAAVAIGIVVVLHLGLIPALASLAVGLPSVALGAAFIAWVLLAGGVILLTVRTSRTTTQALHRNRILYWVPVIPIMIAADIAFFLGRADLSALIRLAGTLLATYIVTAHHLPDVKRIARWVLTFVLTTLIAVALYVASSLGLLFLFQNTLGIGLWVALAITAVILAVLFNPLAQVIQQSVTRRLHGEGFDAGRALGDYSASISNILNIELLTGKVTTIIRETIEADDARLFRVDHVRQKKGGVSYRLRDVKVEGRAEVADGILSSTNPVANNLSVEGHPLAQYDIDFRPEYSSMAEDERAWFASLHMDVYVPIHSRGHWIGLLTVGPKTTRNRYFEDDMALLETLADQTAIALENARLVADLLQLNKDLKQAFADLEKAHNQLNELDRLKSAFIGAITHELRTPIANMQLSIQLIDRYGIQHMLPEQQEQMYQLLNASKHAKIMVDNLVNFATFIGKQGDLKLTDFRFSDLVNETLVMLEPHARRKNVSLQNDAREDGLPALHADRARVGDAVYHLIQNGIKFTEAPGKINARCWVKDGRMYFEVKDTGVGVPPDRLETLWRGFEQMADPLKRGLEGLGLGLALVKYVVDAHDGQTYAQSKPGQGSTFGFYIPLAGPKMRAAPPQEETAPPPVNPGRKR
jgi:signal transduction histidine kinase